MGVAGSIMTYIIVWWLVLFCLLPIGVRSQAENGEIVPGTEPGAPVHTGLFRKAIWATGISFVVWGIMFAVVNYGLLAPKT
jgi:predicted secreted protein